MNEEAFNTILKRLCGGRAYYLYLPTPGQIWHCHMVIVGGRSYASLITNSETMDDGDRQQLIERFTGEGQP